MIFCREKKSAMGWWGMHPPHPPLWIRPWCVLIISAEGGYVFTSVCLSVCLSVYPSDNWKSCEHILQKFLGRVGHGPGTNEFNFGDDPDHRPDPGVRSPKSAFAGLSKKLPTDFDEILWRAGSLFGKYYHIVNTHRTDALQKSFRPSNSIMLVFGGGLCSLSTSSCSGCYHFSNNILKLSMFLTQPIVTIDFTRNTFFLSIFPIDVRYRILNEFH